MGKLRPFSEASRQFGSPTRYPTQYLDRLREYGPACRDLVDSLRRVDAERIPRILANVKTLQLAFALRSLPPKHNFGRSMNMRQLLEDAVRARCRELGIQELP